MSLVVTAKANGVNLFAYLKEVLIRLPTHKDAAIDELLTQTFVKGT